MALPEGLNHGSSLELVHINNFWLRLTTALLLLRRHSTAIIRVAVLVIPFTRTRRQACCS